MTEQRTTDPRTGMDKFFAALRSLGVRRRTDDKWIAGVCSGLADRLGVDPVIVRAALVLLSILGGIGVTVYLLAWALLPNDKDQIAAERALRDGDGGSIVLVVIAAFAFFGGSWWGHGASWGFPWGLALTGLLVWWFVQRSRNRPAADQRVSAQQPAGPNVSAAPPMYGPLPATSAPMSATYGSSPTTVLPSPSVSSPPPTAYRPAAVARPRRRSGGPLMAVLAIGVALVTYGSLSWLGTEFSWAGNHAAVAFAGSLGAIGLLLVVLGFAGWRAGFVVFLAVVLGLSAWGNALVPTGIQVSGRIGNAAWTPTSVVVGTNYHLGVGDGVLDLSKLPTQGLSTATVPPTIPASVGLGDLEVLVPSGLNVKVVGHVGLGEILLPGDARNNGQGGSDVSRSIVMGDGPTEVVVNAEVGIGQLTVVKE
jgi:phage shock protein PspC (stress-responsive transcriptional regulator)